MLNVYLDRYAYAFIVPSEDGSVHFVARDLERRGEFAVRP